MGMEVSRFEARDKYLMPKRVRFLDMPSLYLINVNVRIQGPKKVISGSSLYDACVKRCRNKSQDSSGHRQVC